MSIWQHSLDQEALASRLNLLLPPKIHWIVNKGDQHGSLISIRHLLPFMSIWMQSGMTQKLGTAALRKDINKNQCLLESIARKGKWAWGGIPCPKLLALFYQRSSPQSKHLKAHLAPPMSDVTFLGQRPFSATREWHQVFGWEFILCNPWVTSRFWVRDHLAQPVFGWGSTAVGSGPLRAERRRREAWREIFTTPELVTARQSILGPPAESRPGPSIEKKTIRIYNNSMFWGNFFMIIM